MRTAIALGSGVILSAIVQGVLALFAWFWAWLLHGNFWPAYAGAEGGAIILFCVWLSLRTRNQVELPRCLRQD